MEKNKFINRFLKYVSFETTSVDGATVCPSSDKEFELSKYLVEELHSLGIKNAFMDEHSYVYAFIEGDKSLEPIGLIAHVDTSPDASGKNINAKIVESYDGLTIELSNGIYLDPKKFECLNGCLNHTLITTDGTTLLGADDKAGVAIIMSIVEDIMNDNIKHPDLVITFTPDEEIGEGTSYFNFDYYKEHNCHLAYTVDGGSSKFYSFENFNAAGALVEIIGRSIHPGDAYKKMINASKVAMEFHSMLPSEMTPELTFGYDGFNHLTDMSGSCEKATLEYIIRNHNKEKFEYQKTLFTDIQKKLNEKYGYDICKVTIKDSYYNMIDVLKDHYDVVSKIEKAYNHLGISAVPEPIRGGTDGARLTFEGIYTPNLGTGGHNCHGPYEFLDVDDAMLMIKIIKQIIVE